MRRRLRTRKRAYGVALATGIAVVASLLHALTSPVVAAPQVTQGGITCNTVPAAELGTCIGRMLNDPNGAYSADHVYTDAEKQPVYAPRMAAAAAAPANAGSWSIVADCTVGAYKVNAIHTSLTKSGKVLMTAGSGYNRTNFDQKVFKTWLWDPTAPPGTCPREIPMPADVDLFCSGHSHLPDGRVLFFGGTGRYSTGDLTWTGIREAFAFDDATETFTSMGLMNVARWYPNGPVNAVGNPVIVSGLDAAGKLTSVNESFNPATGSFTKLPGNRIFPLYAGMVLRKNGTLCYSGANWGGRAGASPGCWNWTNNAWYPIPGLLYPDCRDQASTLLLYPAQTQKFMVIGGGCGTGVTGTTATVDMNQPSLKFASGPYLGFAAMHTCAAILPDKSAFVAGGADHNKNPRLQAAVLPAGATAWQQVASPTVPRMYHSSCLVLPDGSVVTLGTTSPGGVVESRFEVYKPWYMQPGAQPRPSISSVATTMKLGGTYPVTYSGPASVAGAMLTRLTSVTHSSDPNQRSVDVPVTAVRTSPPKSVNLKIEPNRGILPPGMYMLTLRDWRNIPSKATIVRIVETTTAVAAAGVRVAPAAADCCCCGSGCC